MAANAGWVSIGNDHDTAAFAVASIRNWWQARGRHDYPRARRLLITTDGGGSNGYRTRGWKTQLAGLAAESGLEITVCHLPPGTSKWNKIEHRLFSHITMNWRGRPLTSHEVMLQTIAATTSRTGLTVQAELDHGEYPTGIRISDDGDRRPAHHPPSLPRRLELHPPPPASDGRRDQHSRQCLARQTDVPLSACAPGPGTDRDGSSAPQRTNRRIGPSDGDSTRASAPHTSRPRAPGGPRRGRQGQAHPSR